ncbi:MAG: selenocysteine-specific translation elongation factor [Candidatus Sericytochromatia bacterium]|nr:selenocysteine-specific translation elongation factor [Candidatus Sericytochromatia bacterium]
MTANRVPIVIGTAGHVDHGKTSLVRQLTGVDTDRLIEEQRRGLTIDLGFAAMTLPSGRVASVVDVPGHERFLKNMLAGVGGMDLVLLVVAADDGVMPQTREHLLILELLGLPAGLIVMTKTDLAGEDLRELAEGDIREGLRGTSWAEAPLFPVSNVTGEGLEPLIREMDERTGARVSRPAGGSVRLAVDRVFVRQGFGTVVTGTLTSGTLREGAALVLEPGGHRVRVRGLQVHGEALSEVPAGHRVAVNLATTGTPEVVRGHWLLAPDTLVSSEVLDVHMLAAAHDVRHGERVRLHHGTREVFGRVALAEGTRLPAGAAGLGQLLLEQPLWADFGDRLVLRHYDPGYVVGGARVVAPAGQRLRRRDQQGWARLAAAADGRWHDRLAIVLVDRGWTPLSVEEARAMVPADHRSGIPADLEAKDLWLSTAHGGLHPGRLDELDGLLRKLLAELPAHRRLIRREELQGRVRVQASVLGEMLARLPDWEVRGRWIVPSGTERRVPDEVTVAWERIQALAVPYRGLLDRGEAQREAPPIVADLLDEALALGDWLDLGQDILVHRTEWEAWQARVREVLAGQGGTSTAAIREALGLTRRFIVPLLEAMDARGLTRRNGESRQWVE